MSERKPEEKKPTKHKLHSVKVLDAFAKIKTHVRGPKAKKRAMFRMAARRERKARPRVPTQKARREGRRDDGEAVQQ